MNCYARRPVHPAPIQVFVADDHPIVIEGLRRHMAHVDDVEFAGCASTLADAFTAVDKLGVHVVVMDVQMPGVDGGGSVRRFVDANVRVVLFTLREEDALVASLVAGGASGFVSKSAPPAELLEAVRIVHRGGEVLSETVRAMAGATQAPPHSTLTEREHEVFVHLARCLTPKEIAFEIGVSQSTVYTHVERVRRKLGVATLAEVVQYAKDWAIPLGAQ